MQQYYYSQYDRECGPCSEITIVNMIRSGISDVWVRRDGDDQWYPIGDLPEELFPFARAMRPSSPPLAAAERDALGRTNVTDQTSGRTAVTNGSILTIENAWIFLGGGGMLLAIITLISMKDDASAGVRIGIFAGSIINFVFCLTMSLVCKTCKTYLQHKRPRRS